MLRQLPHYSESPGQQRLLKTFESSRRVTFSEIMRHYVRLDEYGQYITSNKDPSIPLGSEAREPSSIDDYAVEVSIAPITNETPAP